MAFRPKTYSDEELLNQLQKGSLPPLAFTHKNHVRLVWILYHQSVTDLSNEVRKTILHYATAIGEGQIFHETLTYAAVKVIEHFIQESKAANFEAFMLEHPALAKDFKTLIAQHYSEEVLKSSKAKAEIIEPDLKPF